MDKIVVGVFGKINSGKSTLVNSLAKESVSIVSNVRGTTSEIGRASCRERVSINV